MNKLYRRKVIFGRIVGVLVLLSWLTVLCMLSGCAVLTKLKTKSVGPSATTSIPIPVQSEPPKELTQTYEPAAEPEWVSPEDPSASSCITKDGEDQLRINEIIQQWLRQKTRAWASGEIL